MPDSNLRASGYVDREPAGGPVRISHETPSSLARTTSWLTWIRRWPAQELAFRQQKAAVSLNRVCGYGKKLVNNERVRDELKKLTEKKKRLETDLQKPINEIRKHDTALATLILKERRLRQKTKIKNGERVASAEISQQLAKIRIEIKRQESAKI